MVGGVEKPVESDRPEQARDRPLLRVQMLGPLTVWRDGVTIALASSRKVRALFAYLALAPHAVTRSQLCELLWDVPNDPRGELRWCLSKVRSIIDEPGRRRVEASGDAIRLDLSDCSVDAIEVAQAVRDGIETLDPERLRGLCALFNGDFLEGLEIDRSPAFNGWLVAQRRRFRACHAVLLEHLVGKTSDDEAFRYLERWLEIVPFDQRVHEMLLSALARRGRIREGEEHLDAARRLLEAEGLDWAPLRDFWRSARAQVDVSPRLQVIAPAPESASSGAPSDIMTTPRRASIAVTPFITHDSAVASGGGFAEGLAHDVITRLAKLRTLFVIAQGTMSALHERRVSPAEAGQMLKVDYVVSGSLRRQGKHLAVMVELAETRTGRIVWADMFDRKLDDAFLVLDEIGNRIVASIVSEIETLERNRAILRPPNSLDAWEAYHRGLWHMYRFHRAENEQAQHFFRTAIQLDPTFSRAYAGLSFTHFQNAFQGWAKREPEVDLAFEAAGQSLMADDRDPAAHWAMGRALWMRGRQEQAIAELEHSIDLSPNFALGHYTLGFVHSQAGDARAAIDASDYSRQLSPFDPMLFGMLGARAMALVRLGRFDEAAEWGTRAAARPNAFPHILAIAAYSLALAGRTDEARAHLATIHKMIPGYDLDDFLAAMQFSPEGAALFREAARRIKLG